VLNNAPDPMAYQKKIHEEVSATESAADRASAKIE
jgi:hypothetical protein